MFRAGVFNTNRIIVNDWSSLCLRKILIYQLNYSENCTGNRHHCDSIIEGYQFIMTKDRAFESLLSQNYSSFILTIECIGVSIYHTDNRSYKIFDFHAIDEYGRSQPSGASVLLEVASIASLLQCFQAIINTHSVTIFSY